MFFNCSFETSIEESEVGIKEWWRFLLKPLKNGPKWSTLSIKTGLLKYSFPSILPPSVFFTCFDAVYTFEINSGE